MLFAYGVANVTTGLSGALVTGNSPSRSAAMHAAGARSQLPSLVAAGTITMVMLFFTDVLALGPLKAVMIAFLLTTIDVVRRASKPGTWVLRAAQDGSHFVPTETIAAADESGLIVYRFGSPLYFANAHRFLEEVETLITQAPAPLGWFVLDAEAMTDVDTTGAEVLHQVLQLLASRDVTFALARANPQLPSLLQRYGLLELIGEDRLYPTNRHAVAALCPEHLKTVSQGDSAAGDPDDERDLL